MKKIGLLLSLFISLHSFADLIINERIMDILEPEKSDETYLLLVSDGKVYEVNKRDDILMAKAYRALETNSLVEIEFKNRSSSSDRPQVNKITFKAILFSTEEDIHAKFYETPLGDYVVDSLETPEEAEAAFKSMRTDTRSRSQCYNRAHVWTYELFKNRGLKSGKLWMFFTRRYIREYRYNWWFHVTPYIEVEGASELVMLDRKFTSKPTVLIEWKNIFMKNQAHCPIVDRYSDYYEHQEEAYCYHIKSSMYYWQPYNIENLEEDGTGKYEFIDWEVNKAYRNATGWW